MGFRISVHIFHIHSKLCFQSTGNIIIYYMRMLVIRNKGQIWKKSPDGPIIFYIKKKKKKNYNTSCLLCSEFRYTYSIYTQNYAFKAQVISSYIRCVCWL